MKLPIYQIDAFTSEVFKGNPAAIVPLSKWLPDATLQSIACENNLSETAYFVPANDAYEIRWFTTVGEIDLCGHATLASAYVLFKHLGYKGETIHFKTRQAGDLFVKYDGEYLTLDFPVRDPAPIDNAPPELFSFLNDTKPDYVLLSRDYVVVYKDEATIQNMNPDYRYMEKIGRRVCITAPGKTVDFVSRFFCPAGDAMREDPVTGSSHCSLVPYWAKRLGKTELKAKQLSQRGGELLCRLEGTRVYLSGKACTYMVGEIYI